MKPSISSIENNTLPQSTVLADLCSSPFLLVLRAKSKLLQKNRFLRLGLIESGLKVSTPQPPSPIRKSSHWFMMSWPGMRSWLLWKPLHYLVWSLADSFMRGWHRCSSMEWRQRSCSYCRRAWMCLGVGSRSPTRWGSAKWVSWFIPWTLTRTELRYPETLPLHHITSTRTQWAQMKERKKVPQIFKASVITIWLFNSLPWKITIVNR